MPAPSPSPFPWFHRAFRTPAALVLIGLCTTGLGYRAGLDRTAPPATLRLDELPARSEFTRWDSFSEIGMLRSQLRGLCHRALHELNVVTLQQRTLARASQGTPIASIAALSDLVDEFRQTPEEEPALKILLFRLSRTTDHDRWLDRYLDFTRRNPMSSLVADLQSEAEAMARACGRESELGHMRRLLVEWRSTPLVASPSP